tara:strand:- start:825 stop:1394 length:570 start_codon:yes stop_codon:yes gene_type:complete
MKNMNKKAIIEKLDLLKAQYETTEVDTNERFYVSVDIFQAFKEAYVGGVDHDLHELVQPRIGDCAMEILKAYPRMGEFLKGSSWYPEPMDKPNMPFDVGSLVNLKMKVFKHRAFVSVGQQVFDIVETGPRIVTSIEWSTKENVWSIETFGDELPTGIEVEPGYSRTGIVDIGKVYVEAPETIEVLERVA